MDQPTGLVGRRQLLLVGAGVWLAGCTGSDDSGVSDADGDGMIDSEDYAPNDPEVQEKSDVNAGTDGSGTGGSEPRTGEPDTDRTERDAGGGDDGSAGTGTGDPTSSERTEAKTETATPQPTEVEFPSYSGVQSITAGQDFWSFRLDVPVEFELRYTVRNQLESGYDFDVFLFDEAEFEDYRSRIGGGATNPNAINRASIENVKEGGERTAVIDPGVYYFVVDNTDIGDAGDWGAEETREVAIDLETGPA